MSAFPQDGLKRLAGRILGGEVVFFIGAGFSVDSEPNTASNLIARLLSRFEALTDILVEGRDLRLRSSPAPTASVKDLGQCAESLQKRLINTFSLARRSKAPEVLTHKENLWLLADKYYPINDWMCSAFTELLRAISNLRRSDLTALSARVQARENELLAFYSLDSDLKPSMVPNQPMELDRLLSLKEGTNQGKALFLDTLGFNNPAVMGGDPLAPRMDRVAASYAGERGGLLRPRHHVLAWLAREGLCPTLLTTNYDLLLEGGFRLAGFAPRVRVPEGLRAPHEPSANDFLPPTTYHYFSSVADATQFFGRGEDRRAALILKIHGSVDLYRSCRESTPYWETYLPSMVFTFREIQDWRQDSWSRDYLRTLLRTRTLVFCGYSGMDQVVHHTFRTVYEEMAARRRDRRLAAQQDQPARNGPDPVDAKEAPAFFFSLDDRKEFHGLEILRAASQAAGTEIPDLADHPNYIQFYKLRDSEQRFPRLDEVKQWIFHLVFRQRQRQSLESDLGRIATLLLGHPQPDVELQAIRQGFEALLAAEEAMATNWTEKPESRHQLERTAAWTQGFQTGLLRQLALGDAVLRNQRPGMELEDLREQSWYYPVLDHTDWAAWTTVVELAVRRMIAALRSDPFTWAGDSKGMQPCSCSLPVVFFSRSGELRTPECLVISLATFGRRAKPRAIPGAFRHPILWEIHPDGVPWHRDEPDLRTPRLPDARKIWQWAHLADLRAHPDYLAWARSYFP